MDNYFTSYRLFFCLPTLEWTIFEVCSTKIDYASTLSSGKKKKRNVTTLNSAAHIKQKCCIACMTGKNGKRVLYIASSESYQPKRNLFYLGTKLKKNIFKSHNQMNSTVTTRTWVLSKEWIRTWPKTGLVLNETIVVVPVCFNGRCCSSGCVSIVLN